MEIALYIFLALVGIGALLFFEHRRHLAKHPNGSPSTEATPAPATGEEEEEECCGMHITCERDSLLASVSKDIEYYDDEELDRFRGVNPADYTEADVEMFRDILLTLLPHDIAGWARSLQLRGIELPATVREELLMVVAENRKMNVNHPEH